MKKLVLLCFFIVLKFSLTEKSFARVPANNAELIIEIDDAAPGRNLPDIESALQSLGGVSIVGFCNSEKCLFMNVDRNIQPTNDNIFRAIINLGYHPDLKTSGTIQQAQDACKDR
ncbi:MAG TPA: hypothetical protein VFJ43_06710 [Bacteroidia bacterium]|nr:hypothetical protein [Bacteroidia bacterium]